MTEIYADPSDVKAILRGSASALIEFLEENYSEDDEPQLRLISRLKAIMELPLSSEDLQ